MIERIKSFIEKQKLNSSSFANELGVQRSSVSHILSGRNKPSLDFILKLKNHYPELNFDWILTGKGSMFMEKASSQKSAAASKRVDKVKSEAENDLSLFNQEKEKSTIMNEPGGETPMFKSEDHAPYYREGKSKKVKKIILLYADNSFEEFSPR